MTHLLYSGSIFGRTPWQSDAYVPDYNPNVSEAGMLLGEGRLSTDPPGAPPAPLDPWIDDVPHTILVKRIPKGGMPDFDFQHFILVSDRVREKLEALEPDVHRFLPLRIVEGPSGKEPGREHDRRWIVHVTEAPDIIDHARTWYALRGEHGAPDRDGVPDFMFKEFNPKPDAEIGHPVVGFRPGPDGRGVEGRHLWRGTIGRADWHQTIVGHSDGPFPSRRLWFDDLRRKLFVSDEFAAFLKQRGMRGMVPIPIADPEHANRIGRAGEWYCGYKAINDPEADHK